MGAKLLYREFQESNLIFIQNTQICVPYRGAVCFSIYSCAVSRFILTCMIVYTSLMYTPINRFTKILLESELAEREVERSRAVCNLNRQ